MRRLLAALLAPVFSFQLIAPVLFATAGSDLPACCRRGGQHHCAMSMQSAEPSPGPAAAAHRDPCPYFPRGGAVLPHADAALGSVFPCGVLAFRSVYANRPATLSGFPISYAASHPKRGPPIEA